MHGKFSPYIYSLALSLQSNCRLKIIIVGLSTRPPTVDKEQDHFWRGRGQSRNNRLEAGSYVYFAP